MNECGCCLKIGDIYARCTLNAGHESAHWDALFRVSWDNERAVVMIPWDRASSITPECSEGGENGNDIGSEIYREGFTRGYMLCNHNFIC